MLRLFSDVYQKAVTVLKTSQFDSPEWTPIIRGLRILLADDGPNFQRCAVLDELRAKANRLQLRSGGNNFAVGSAIITLCNESQSGYEDRIALIKFLLHFYLIGKKGGQAVWIADLPQNFSFGRSTCSILRVNKRYPRYYLIARKFLVDEIAK